MVANVVQAEVNRVAWAWREHGREAGERLVQPEVVPPAHGDQVAEPHVRHLVQDRVGAPLVRVVGDLRAEDVVVEERDAGRVLHRAGVELGHEQLVVLVERIAVVERAVIPVEALLGDQQDLVGVEVLGQRGPAVDAEVDPVVAVGHLVVRPGDQRGDVRRERRGGAEPDDLRAADTLGDVLGSSVGDDLPVRRRGHRERECPLEVGLVEAGVHPLRVRGLELRVEVDLAVDRVDEPVQPLAGVRVEQVGVDDEHVVGGQVGQRQPVLRPVGRGVQRPPVEGDLVEPVGDHVDERGRPRPGRGEPDRGPGPEGPLAGLAAAVGQVELHLVPGYGQQLRAGPCIDPGQVGDTHPRSLSCRPDCTDRVVRSVPSGPQRECDRAYRCCRHRTHPFRRRT